MPSRCFHCHSILWTFISLVVLMPFAITGCGDEPATEGGSSSDAGRSDSSQESAAKDSPSYFADNIIKAWEQAGAQAGWIRPDDQGDFWFREGTKKGYGAGPNLPDDLPAFQFSNWKEGVIAELPVPAVAFALDLPRTRVTDVGLKELAKLESLQLLNLDNTNVGDAGVKELIGLQNLRAINLHYTDITDAGLRELTKLKNLRSVNLNGVKVSSNALFQLNQALPDCTIYRRR
jgi:Leucine-rich repeat (LRR) protein